MEKIVRRFTAISDDDVIYTISEIKEYSRGPTFTDAHDPDVKHTPYVYLGSYFRTSNGFGVDQLNPDTFQIVDTNVIVRKLSDIK